MKVIVHMEIETGDYGGSEFKDEIEKLIKDIDSTSELIKFLMYAKDGQWNNEKDIAWKQEET